jgi:hypothetical protein
VFLIGDSGSALRVLIRLAAWTFQKGHKARKKRPLVLALNVARVARIARALFPEIRKT